MLFLLFGGMLLNRLFLPRWINVMISFFRYCIGINDRFKYKDLPDHSIGQLLNRLAAARVVVPVSMQINPICNYFFLVYQVFLEFL
jgi:hypothetical protein